MRRWLVAPIASGFLLVSACGGGGGGADIEAYCDAIRSFQALEEDFSNPDIPADASFEDQMKAMRETFEPLKKRIGEMRDAAPSEIRDDVGELADAAEELLDVFLSADSLEDLTDPELAERMTKLQRDAEAARDRVAAYTKKECGIDLTEDAGG